MKRFLLMIFFVVALHAMEGDPEDSRYPPQHTSSYQQGTLVTPATSSSVPQTRRYPYLSVNNCSITTALICCIAGAASQVCLGYVDPESTVYPWLHFGDAFSKIGLAVIVIIQTARNMAESR